MITGSGIHQAQARHRRAFSLGSLVGLLRPRIATWNDLFSRARFAESNFAQAYAGAQKPLVAAANLFAKNKRAQF
jgi:hypothetical protein